MREHKCSSSSLSSNYFHHSSLDLIYRSYPIEGFVDDYAFVIRGLLDLYEVCQDERWVQWAEELQERQNALFWDSEGGAFFSNSGRDASIVLRLKDGLYFQCCIIHVCSLKPRQKIANAQDSSLHLLHVDMKTHKTLLIYTTNC